MIGLLQEFSAKVHLICILIYLIFFLLIVLIQEFDRQNKNVGVFVDTLWNPLWHIKANENPLFGTIIQMPLHFFSMWGEGCADGLA